MRRFPNAVALPLAWWALVTVASAQMPADAERTTRPIATEPFGESPGLRTFLLPKPPTQAAERDDELVQEQRARTAAREPRSTDVLRTTLGVGYVQGADWGAEAISSGAVAGVHVQLNTLVTKGAKGVQLDQGTLALRDVNVGWGLQLGDIFSSLVGVSRGARLEFGKSHHTRALSVYGPAPFSSDRRTVVAYRENVGLPRRVRLEGEVASDRGYIIQGRAPISRVEVAASFRQLAKPRSVREAGVQTSLRLWGGFNLSGSAITERESENRSQWWTVGLRLPASRFFALTLERTYARNEHTASAQSAVMANVTAGQLRLFHRYQSGDIQLFRPGGDTHIEREQLQSLSSYRAGTRLSMALQLVTQWTVSGQTQHWEELQTTLKVTPTTSLQTTTAVPNFLDPQRLRVRIEQQLFRQFSLQAEYGRLSTYQGLVRELERSRFKVMVRKRVEVTSPSRGGEVHGRVLDQNGRPVAGVRVRLGPYSMDTRDDGAYSFRHMPSGSFELSIDSNYLPADYAWDDRRVRLPITPSTHLTADLLVAPLNAIHGRIFLDRNNNGQFDFGEGLSGAVVHLQDRVTLSERDGVYDFYNVAPGTYAVWLDLERLPESVRSVGSSEISVALGDDRPTTGADFKVAEKPKPIIWDGRLR